MYPALKKLNWTNLPILAAFGLSVALAPIFRAQDQGSITKVTPLPDGAFFTVDGANYTHAVSNIWPTGSKHTLSAITPQYPPTGAKATLTFDHWEFNGGNVSLNPFVITATPTIPEYRAVFSQQYALSVIFFNCPDPAHCASPGRILVDGSPVTTTTDIYCAPGASVTLLAIPNPGYVFAGWQGGTNQYITGAQDIVTMNGPIEVYPRFQVARHVNIATVPDGLQILADRTPVYAGTVLDWGWDSVHSIGPVSPQQDKLGKYWAFKSWSDGGAINHAYTVAESNMPDTITATYVPAAPFSIVTQPLGLRVKVDGVTQNILNPYYYTWGVNEVHRLEAPLTQTDASGRNYQFAGWSDGGAAIHDYTVAADADITGGAKLVATYKALTKLTVDSSLTALSIKVNGTSCTTPCETLYSPGTQVRVTVPPSVALGQNTRADFNGWPTGGSDFTVSLGDADQRLLASYHILNRLSASSDPSDGAVYSLTPSSPDSFYDSSATVAITLTAQPGFKFVRWDGDLSGTIPSGMVAMSAPRAVRGLLNPVPYIAPTGVMNAAGLTPQKGVAPGSMISIFGAHLANGSAVAGDGLLPQTLAGVVARAGDRLLPLIYASPTQINAQLPDDIQPGDQLMTVSPPGQPDLRAAFKVVRNAPGLFPVMSGDSAFAMAVHEDGSPINADSPARHGELITVYGTGFGPTATPRPEGFPIPASGDYSIADSASVQVGDTVIIAEKAFALPGRQGIDAVQFRLGDDAPSSTTSTFKLTVNGVDSNTVMLVVQ
ncbi:MAG TPA: hypothetical protein VKE70_39065 [Candidatus Solibacter sp.]|nr:hypothetical protein [Candidatus Solibacter sp.]